MREKPQSYLKDEAESIVRRIHASDSIGTPEEIASRDMQEIADRYRKQIADALSELTHSA